MNNNKSKKIFIISIIVLVILLIAGMAYAMFATDIFKSDKELFFKYASQIFTEDGNFVDKRLEQYIEKQSNTEHTNSGKFSIGEDKEELFEVLSYSGKMDSNNNVEEDIKFNFSDKVNIPVTYKKVKDEHGIKISEISKRFFTVDEGDFNDLFSSMLGIPVSTSTKKSVQYADSDDETNNSNSISLDKMLLTDAEKEKINKNYLQPLQEKLDSSMFSKIATTEGTGYSISITNVKAKEIYTQFLKTLKDDEAMIDKLNSTYGLKIKSDDIEDQISRLEESDTTEKEDKLIITVYQTEGVLNKIEVEFGDVFKVSVAKSSNSNDLIYKILMQNQQYSINLEAAYTGLQTLEEVQGSYTVEVNGETSGIINFENTDNFAEENIKISKYDEENTMNLGELSEQKLQKFMVSFTNALGQLIQEKMDEANLKIDLDNLDMSNIFNPFQSSSSTSSLSSKKEETETTTNTENEENNEEKTKTNTTTSNTSSSTSNVVTGMEKLEKTSFNEKFQQYEGDNVKGTTVKSLIMQIIANNMVEDGKKVEVTGSVSLTGNEVPESIQASKTYKVKCVIGTDGYVNKVSITEK